MYKFCLCMFKHNLMNAYTMIKKKAKKFYVFVRNVF